MSSSGAGLNAVLHRGQRRRFPDVEVARVLSFALQDGHVIIVDIMSPEWFLKRHWEKM